MTEENPPEEDEDEYHFVCKPVAQLGEPAPGAVVELDVNGHEVYVAPETNQFIQALGPDAKTFKWCNICAEEHFRTSETAPKIRELPGQDALLRSMGYTQEQIDHARARLRQELGIRD